MLPRSNRAEALRIDGRCLSFRLFVCLFFPYNDPKSRTEGHRKLENENKEDRDRPWPHLEVKGQGHQAA